jgi:hypothetical protein
LVLIYFSLLLIVSGNLNAAEGAVEAIPEDKALALEAVGTLSSSNLYLAYLSITLIKKNIDDGKYEALIKDIIDPVEHTLGLINQQLNKLKKISGLSEEDYKIISDIEAACSLLKDDTALLKLYLKSKSVDDNGAFEKKHKEAGSFLEKLFKGGDKTKEK